MYMASDSIHKTAADILFTYINNSNLEAGLALIRDKEVDLNIGNCFGMTPLHLAVKINHLSYVSLLLENGADPNVKEDYSVGSETPIFKAVENNSYEVVKILLDYGADPSAKNKSGFNSLHIAAKNGFLEICVLLISRGLDPNIRDEFGNNASYWAKRNRFTDLLPFLPPVQSIEPENLVEYRDQMDEMMFGLTAEEKKKLQAKKKK